MYFCVMKNYNTRQMQQNNWQMSKGEDRMPAFPLGRASSGTGVYFPRIASHPPTKKTGYFLMNERCA